MNEERKSKPDFMKQGTYPDFTVFADLVDSADQAVDKALQSGHAEEVYEALDSKRRIVEEWFPGEMISEIE